MSLIKREYRAAYAVLFASFILFGISVTVIGAALPRVLADFHWDYLGAGVVIAAGSVGIFVAAYVAGRLIDRLGFRRTMLMGLGVNAGGLLLFAMVPSVPLNAFLYFMIGVGQGFIEVAVNWAVVRMAPMGAGRAMSLMHGAFSIGAVAGPLATGAILAAGVPWSLAYRGVGILFVVLLVAMLAVPVHGLEGGSPAQRHHRSELHREPTFWLGFVVLLLYVGTEMGTSSWLSEYFVSALGASASTGAFAVSAFWGGLLVGRFGMPWIYRGPRHDRVLWVLGCLMTLATTTLAIVGFTGGLPVAVVASIVGGLGCSCVYPIAISLVGEAFPEAQGEAMGFAAAGGGLGSFLFPLMAATIAKSWGIRIAYVAFVPMALAVLAACAFLAAAAHRRAQQVREALPAAPVTQPLP